MAFCKNCGSDDVRHAFTGDCIGPCRHGFISYHSQKCDCLEVDRIEFNLWEDKQNYGFCAYVQEGKFKKKNIPNWFNN